MHWLPMTVMFKSPRSYAPYVSSGVWYPGPYLHWFPAGFAWNETSRNARLRHQCAARLMTVKILLLGVIWPKVSDVRTLWRNASLSTLYTHPTGTTAADAGCQGNQTDNPPENLDPSSGTKRRGGRSSAHLVAQQAADAAEPSAELRALLRAVRDELERAPK
eukprot:3051039-Pyramimonas_sp.AAC.1